MLFKRFWRAKEVGRAVNKDNNVCFSTVVFDELTILTIDDLLLTIDQLLAKELIVFMFKQKNGKNPSAFKDVFTKNESKYNTRNKSIFIPKKCFSTVCQQAISHRGPAYWNCIPFDLKNKKQSVRFFTLEVYKYFLSNGNNT